MVLRLMQRGRLPAEALGRPPFMSCFLCRNVNRLVPSLGDHSSAPILFQLSADQHQLDSKRQAPPSRPVIIPLPSDPKATSLR